MDNERRVQLHELNARAWNGEQVFPLKSQKLDSSIKRNTGFIKKLKQGINKESKASLLKDLSEVLLEKYLSEIINTAAEGLSNVSSKNDDIIAAVEVISGMHQRFNASFTCELLEIFLHNFASPTEDSLPEKEEVARVNKLKSNMRVFTELYLVGVFTTLDNVNSRDGLPAFLQKKPTKREPILFRILKEILNYKFKSGCSTSLATSFVKRFPFLLDSQDTSLDVCIYDSDLKPLLQTLFKIFTDAVFSRTTELGVTTKRLLKEHKKCQIRTGKLSDEYIEEYNYCSPIYERFKSTAVVLADFFHLEKPALDDEQAEPVEEGVTSVITNTVPLVGQKLWENEETRKFYEILPNIDEPYRRSLESKVDASGDAINDFFRDLGSSETKETIDSLSVEYWSKNLDNKATRKRLLKFLIETQDWSKLRIYARFLATNAKYFPEVIEEFTNYLDSGFRSQLHSNRINVKNIIFFSEMVKFMLLPTYLIFHKIRALIMNLQVPNNIEILTIFFEHLGIFLVNKPEYKSHTEKMIELIKENKKDRQLNMNLKGALDNLINLVYPPSIRSLNADAKTLTPEQNFYRILIRRELGNFDYKHVIRLLRKANWKDHDVYDTLFELFTKPEDVSYQNISLLARVLKELFAYHRNFVIKCIDDLLENIERGLEINDYGQNMHRIAEVKYLTEMYNCELIRPQVLIDTIFNIMNFGHSRKGPTLFSPNDTDLKGNYFRIQLISTVLLNATKTSPSFKNKLKIFLMFFEYYIFTKETPIPKEIQFRIEATFDNFTFEDGFERSKNMQESAMRLSDALKATGISSARSEVQVGKANSVPQENNVNVSDAEEEEFEVEYDPEMDNDDQKSDLSALDNEEESDEDYDEDDEEDDEDEEEDDDDDDDSDVESSDGEDDEYSEEDESDEDVYRDIDADRDIEKRRMYEEFQMKLRGDEERKIAAEMEKQFQQILTESAVSRRNEKTSSVNIPLISSRQDHTKPKLLSSARTSSSSIDQNSSQPSKIAFTFLSKSGKKTQSRVLGLPSNIEFVSGVLEEEERLKSEREKIKKIVLQRAFD